MRCGGTNSLVISFDIGPEALFALRGAVGLSGDAYCLVRRLQASKIERLNQPLAEMATALEKFRDLRNFFSHLDDRLAHLDRHGITGTVSAGCGIEYENAKGCFHLVLMGNRIHFTSSGVALEVDVSKVAVLNMLRSARLLYAEITSHKIHKQNYPGPEALYA